ncbi:MAG: polysaccharide biosynthesis protein, partial [Oscillospiraceae bacterium]
HADMVRYFLTIPEAANLIIESGKYSTDGEIFTLTMGDPIKIYDLALRLISCYNLVPNVDIDVVFTGLRPGEQLGEERHILQNEVQLEQDDRISVSPRVEVDFDKLISSLDYLFKDGSSSFDAIKNHMEDILQKYDPMYDK